MITHIIYFWERFTIHHEQIATMVQSGANTDSIIQKLESPLKKIHKSLSLVIVKLPMEKPQLFFLAKGRLHLKKLISQILLFAPRQTDWEFQLGIEPWEGTLQNLCLKYRFLGLEVEIYQIYFALSKINKSSGRMNLVLYVEKNKTLQRYVLNNQMKLVLLFYLGDDVYHKNIAHIKIALKKYKAYNFAPVSQLKKIFNFAIVP